MPIRRAAVLVILGLATLSTTQTLSQEPVRAEPGPAKPGGPASNEAKPADDASETPTPETDAAKKPTLAWELLATIPDPVGFAGPFAGVAGSSLVVAGGANFPGGRHWQGADKVWHDRIFVLPEPDGEWAEASIKLPKPLAYGVSLDWTHETSDGNTESSIVCIGGGDQTTHSDAAFLIHHRDGKLSFEDLPSLPSPRAFFCGVVLDGVVYVAGGQTNPTKGLEPQNFPTSTTALQEFLSLDLKKPAKERSWKTLEAWPGPGLILAVAAAQDGSVYLFSGAELNPKTDSETGKIQGVRTIRSEAYRYTPSESGGTWLRVADCPTPLVAAPTPAIASGSTHILVLPGDDGSLLGQSLNDKHPGFPATIWQYHTVTDTWVSAGEMLKDPGPDPESKPELGTWPPVTTTITKWHGKYVVPSGETRPGIRTSKVVWAELDTPSAALSTIDYAVLAAYLASLVGMGVYFSRRERTTADFFLGGQRIPWWAAGLSIFGTQLSAITFMAIPAQSYASNWKFFVANMMIVVIAPVVVFVYLPFFRRLPITSAYEYLEKRFDSRVRLVGSATFSLFQLGRMGVVLYLPSLALATVTGFDVFLCIAIMGLLATIYTVLGGIEAVIWTDVVQVFVLLGGALITLFLILSNIEGGFGTIYDEALAGDKLQWREPGWDMLSGAVWVIALGSLLGQLVPYTSDQTVVQRYLSTASEADARRSIWTNTALTIPASLIFFGVGSALWVFYKHNPELLNHAGRKEDIFPWFIATQLPVGVAGLVIAGLFAAAMSSLDSSMNSIATAFTTDFYTRLAPQADDKQRLSVAKNLTILLGFAGTGCACIMAMLEDRSIFERYLEIMGLFGGGLAGLFAAGIFSKKTSAAGVLIGFFVSAVALFAVKQSGSVHFMLYAGVGILSCALVGRLASLLFPMRDDRSDWTLRN